MSAFGFALAGLAGASFGGAIGRRRLPFADGPTPVAADARIFAAVAAVAGAGAAFHGVLGWQLAILGGAAFALAAAAASDLACGSIPDLLTLGPLAAVFAGFALHAQFAPLLAAVVVALPFAVVAAGSRGRGMGWGDVKLVALGAVLLGLPAAVTAFVAAGLAAFVLPRFRGVHRGPIAFAPYLAGGMAFVVTIGA